MIRDNLLMHLIPDSPRSNYHIKFLSKDMFILIVGPPVYCAPTRS